VKKLRFKQPTII